MLVYDIETNAIEHWQTLAGLEVIHCVTTEDTETGEVLRFNDQNNGQGKLEEGFDFIMNAEDVAGHNIIKFDNPAIRTFYPWFKPKGIIWDTNVMSAVMYPEMKDSDFRMARLRQRKGKKWIEPRMYGRHTLESWGARLNCPKDDYKNRCKELGIDPWAAWNIDMEDYCVQDVHTNVVLLLHLLKKGYSPECLRLENDVVEIIQRQEAFGFRFDVEAGGKLYGELAQGREKQEAVLREQIKPWFAPGKKFTPKRDNKKMGYVAGAPLTKIVLKTFNPGSDQQVGDRLMKLYGWKPSEFTPTGQPKVSEEILETLDFPGIQEIVKYLMLNKRVGQLAEGQKAWLKMERNGRMHGTVNTNGAVTGRMTHTDPNVAQTPAGYSPYGKECRSLFTVDDMHCLLGCDAEGLELRALGSYMAKYDKGAYTESVISGKKEDETDAHSLTKKAIGLRSRDNAKTWFYAFIYGAGPYTLGMTVYDDMDKETRPKFSKKLIMRLGKESLEAVAKNLPALGKLSDDIKKVAKKRGYLKGLDGRKLPVRSPHAALNTLLQSAGAVIMKKALVLLDQRLQAKGYLNTVSTIATADGYDYEFTANVHDEFQIECVTREIAEAIGPMAAQSITDAGTHFNFRCPLAGAFDIGKTWAETH